MPESAIRFTSYPLTQPPPAFVQAIVEVFRKHEDFIGTLRLPKQKHLKSNDVLARLRDDLMELGFAVESGRSKEHKIARPVFYGENGAPRLRYEVDAYHPDWQCGLEIEATRGMRGGAFYRDMIQALVMVQVEHLCVGMGNLICYGKGNKCRDYEEACRIAEALFGHSRIRFPYGLTIIGY